MSNGKYHQRKSYDANKTCPRCKGTGRVRDSLTYRLKLLAPYKGQRLMSEQLLRICDYSPKTPIEATLILSRGFIVRISKKTRKYLVKFVSLEAKEALERIKEGTG